MEHNARILLEEFQRLRIENEVLSLNPLGEMGPLLAHRGIAVHGIAYSGKWGCGSFRALRRILQATPADGMLMIGHNAMGMAAIGNRWRAHRTLSIHFHHKGVKPDWQWRVIYRLASWQFQTITFVSNYILSEAIALAPFLKHRLLMVSTPVTTRPPVGESERLQARRRLGLPPSAKIVGNAGWLVPRKRWDVFLDVAGLVRRQVPDTVFLIAGDGPERPALEERAAALGITDRIKWLGWQDTLSEFYSCTDVLLFNSDWDAQARTPLEAMSYGIPIVASILEGGTKEIIVDSSMGVLLARHDIERLAEHIVRLLRDPQLARAVGLRGRARVMEYGSPEQHAQRMLQAMNFDCHRVEQSVPVADNL